MSELNGAAEQPRGIPTRLLVVAIAVAVGAVSALIFVLFNETEGPAPALRTFAERLRDQDCAGSYALLDVSIQARTTEEDWCSAFPAAGERLDPGFRVQQMSLRGRVAEVTIRGRLGSASEVWLLNKVDSEWRVLGPREGFENATSV